VAFTDPRLPGKEYKTERGLKIALSHLQRREAVARLLEEDSLDLQPQAPEPVVASPLNHIRNLHYAVARVRIKNEDRDKSRSITLQPRGQRGDLAKLSEGELASPDYLNNVDILFEAITEDEAGYVIYRQTHNQQAVHPAAAALRTETGNVYEGVVLAEPLAKRSVTVGEVVDTGSGSTQQHKFVVERRQAATIEEVAAPRRSALPGTQDHRDSGPLRSEEEALRVAAEYTRTHKSAEGPAAGLMGFTTPKSFAVQTHAADNPADRRSHDPVVGAER
jgi:hypothetical protein